MEITTNGKELCNSVTLSAKLLQKINIIVEDETIYLIGMDGSKSFLYLHTQKGTGKGIWSGALMANTLLTMLKGCGEETTLLLDSVLSLTKGKRKVECPVEDIDDGMRAHIHRTFQTTTTLNVNGDIILNYLKEVDALIKETTLSVSFKANEGNLTLSVNNNGVLVEEVIEGITGEAMSMYGANFLLNMFNKEDITLKYGNEGILLIEGNNYKMILAPRVDNT